MSYGKERHQEVTTDLGSRAWLWGKEKGRGWAPRKTQKEELDLGRRRDVQVGGPAGCAGGKCESGSEAQDDPNPPQAGKPGGGPAPTVLASSLSVEMSVQSQLQCCPVPRFPHLSQEGVEV